MRNLLPIILGVLSVGTAAYGISYDTKIDGTTPPAGATFTSFGGALGIKTQAGFYVLGVQNGASGNEIDIGEWLQIDLSAPAHWKTLTLGLLFDGTEYGDNKEIAVALTDGNLNYTLTATGWNTAEWSGPGSVTCLSQADENNAAVWQISNPFGDVNVTTVRLYPASSNPGGNESDFGLVAFSTPEGGSSLALLAGAFAMMGAVGRKFRK